MIIPQTLVARIVSGLETFRRIRFFYADFMVLSYMSCSEILPLDNVLGGPVLKPEQKTYDGWNDN